MGSGPEWQTQDLPSEPHHIAPDTTEIRQLVAFPEGDLWHATLPAGVASEPVRHRTVNELWYFLEGEGELWRQDEANEDVIEIHSGRAVSIPSRVSFQFRNTG